MNRLLKFLYRYQNQRRIHTWASFWTVVKMAWAQSGRTSGCDSSVVCHDFIDISSNDDNLIIPIGISLNSCKQNEYVRVIYNIIEICDHEYEYSNGIRKCLKCGKENRYYLRI